MFLLCAFLLARPRTINVRHVHWKHPRFHHALYWLSGLAFCEIALWYMAAELLGLWWLAWLGARLAVTLAGHGRPVPQQWHEVIRATRPIWPRPAPASAP